MQSITEAQAQARVLEAQNKLLKIGFGVALAVIVVAGGYEGGHAVHWW